MADQETHYGVLRLKSKEARAAIVQKLGTDFNLTPILAEAYYQQGAQYFHQHANVTLSSGEIAYEAVAADEPASKHIRLTRKVTTRLKLLDFSADPHLREDKPGRVGHLWTGRLASASSRAGNPTGLRSGSTAQL